MGQSMTEQDSPGHVSFDTSVLNIIFGYADKNRDQARLRFAKTLVCLYEADKLRGEAIVRDDFLQPKEAPYKAKGRSTSG